MPSPGHARLGSFSGLRLRSSPLLKPLNKSTASSVQTPFQDINKQTLTMKKVLLTGFAGLLLLALATPSFAADTGAGKERTYKGEAKCAKCMLKEGDKCQTVVQVGKGEKKVTYYLVDNDVAKNFHDDVCKEAKKVTVTGTVKKVHGKNELTASKIELAKDK